MKGINNKIAQIITKILEITHWVVAALMVAIVISLLVAPQWLGYLMDINSLMTDKEISAYGFEVTVINSNGELNVTAFILFAIGAVIIFSLMAMIFRNLYLIIKKSDGVTPFQKDNVRMLREIGIFSISIPIIGLIMSIITGLVSGIEIVENSVNFSGFIMGIIVFCLTEFFAYGVKLEEDMDGLL